MYMHIYMVMPFKVSAHEKTVKENVSFTKKAHCFSLLCTWGDYYGTARVGCVTSIKLFVLE